MSQELASTNSVESFDFYGDEIIAICDDSRIYVSVKRICESLGLDGKSQNRKLKEHPSFADGLRYGQMTTPGGEQTALFIDLDLLNGWLCTIHPNKVKDEYREKVILYQKEAFKALRDYFFEGHALNEDKLDVDKLAAKVAEMVGLAVMPNRFDNVVNRMNAYERVFQVLGEPDNRVLTTLRGQAIAQIEGDPKSAPTLQENDWWYAADYLRQKKMEGWKNQLYENDEAAVKALGRAASQEARKDNVELIKQNQVLKTGRVIHVNMYPPEYLDRAFDKLAKAGKFVKQEILRLAS